MPHNTRLDAALACVCSALVAMWPAALFAATSQPARAGAPVNEKPFISPNLHIYGDAANSPAYLGATAHDPKFGDTTLWGFLDGKEKFTRSTWPKARLFVYDWQNGCWTENGKPTKDVPDKDTDILLPAAPTGTGYTFKFPSDSERQSQCYRHVTIERGASFPGGGDGIGRKIYGNLWLKRGGQMSAQGATAFLGPNDSFFRSDNDESMNGSGKGKDYTYISQYFTFNKDNTSLEFLGQAKVLDEFQVSCLVIVGRDSFLQAGRSATPTINKNGTLALLDGAYWGKWTNEFHRAIDLVLEGTLEGGLPDRPLKRDCTVGLSFRNWQKVDFSQWSSDPKKGMKDMRLVSMQVRPGGQIKSCTADPQKACLNITWTGIERTNVVGDPHGTDDKSLGMFKDAGFAKAFNAIPRKITVYFDADTMVDGVRFDNVHPGGILIKDLGLRNKWKNVLFGPNNTGKPEELFKQLDMPRSGNY